MDASACNTSPPDTCLTFWECYMKLADRGACIRHHSHAPDCTFVLAIVGCIRSECRAPVCKRLYQHLVEHVIHQSSKESHVTYVYESTGV